MSVELLAFYFFAAVATLAALAVITIRNPVYAVLCLVLTFFSTACVWLLLEAEFVAVALVLVYVGAVMVLFLFVVMMLDVDFAALRGELARYMPLGLVITLVLLVQLGVVFGGWASSEQAEALRMAPVPADQFNTAALGAVIYDKYLLAFQTAGLVLLVAMIEIGRAHV